MVVIWSVIASLGFCESCDSSTFCKLRAGFICALPAAYSSNPHCKRGSGLLLNKVLMVKGLFSSITNISNTHYSAGDGEALLINASTAHKIQHLLYGFTGSAPSPISYSLFRLRQTNLSCSSITSHPKLTPTSPIARLMTKPTNS